MLKFQNFEILKQTTQFNIFILFITIFQSLKNTKET